jgi:hypothetical protein
MIKLTFERDGQEQELKCDGYVLVAWNQELDGSKVFPPLINASSPPEMSGSDMVYAVGTLAIAMQKSADPTVRLSGELLKSTLEKGLTMLEAATESEIKA